MQHDETFNAGRPHLAKVASVIADSQDIWPLLTPSNAAFHAPIDLQALLEEPVPIAAEPNIDPLLLSLLLRHMRVDCQ